MSLSSISLGSDELADGGAAMTAYCKMQFSKMSEVERSLVSKSLLKYCELDTASMIFVLEYFADALGVLLNKKAA